MRLFTIGHSNHTLDKFIHLLEENNVMTVVDVRTAPYSRYSPHFNRESLEHALARQNIQYAHAGKYLGGRPSDPSCYKSRTLPEESADYLHEVDYPEVMKREWFQQGIARLLELADEQTTAIMCSEGKPEECHRHHLIAKYLMAEYPEVDVRHILGDGSEIGASTIKMALDEESAEQLSMPF